MRSVAAGFLAGLLVSLASQAADLKPKLALDKPAFESYVRHLLLWGPQITVRIAEPAASELDGFFEVRVTGSAGEVSQDQVFLVSADGRKLVRATVFDLDKNPFQKDLDRLSVVGAPSLGTPGAPVRLVVFSDFQCAYCRIEAEMLRKNLPRTYPSEVRLYFKDFPLESIHPWSKTAALAGRCFLAQSEEAFWAYHDWAFANQSGITPENIRSMIADYANSAPGVDGLKLGRCLDSKETEPEIARALEEAEALGLNSTPTLFVNGRRITTQLPWGNLKQIIDFEIDYQKTARNAGDADCCSVTLPAPVAQ